MHDQLQLFDEPEYTSREARRAIDEARYRWGVRSCLLQVLERLDRLEQAARETAETKRLLERALADNQMLRRGPARARTRRDREHARQVAERLLGS